MVACRIFGWLLSTVAGKSVPVVEYDDFIDYLVHVASSQGAVVTQEFLPIVGRNLVISCCEYVP